jgi:aromatic-L-amino-acid/L-tryptophan decarboxylase
MPQILQNELEKIDSSPTGLTLDPPDWTEFRAQAHRMLDEILDYIRNIRERPVWQPIPDWVRKRFEDRLPVSASPLAVVHDEFMKHILPFSVGNVHPGFMGWVHGGGTPVGMLAEMLTGGLNANLGGRDQIPVEVERQISRWMQELFRFPETSAGLFVTGTSMANLIAVVVARNAAIGLEVRQHGITAKTDRLMAYSSTETHVCVRKAFELCGLGADKLRQIPTDRFRRMNLSALESAIRHDRENGLHPFLVVGTAGTVDSGAIDDLDGLADIARLQKLWFHVDGAYGALAMLAPDLAPKLCGIEQADSLAFDFHKWGQVPYDAGFILVRDGELQRNAFAAGSVYLTRKTRGLAGGSPWPCDYGPDLSRGFRALKTWFTFKVYGSEALGAAISRTCKLARYLEAQIAKTLELELLAPVELNIVCFRYRSPDVDRVNAAIVVELQESGVVAPSSTTIDGKLAIRAAIVNHRTSEIEIDRLLERTLAIGRRLKAQSAALSTSNETTPPQLQPRLQWDAELKQIGSKLESDPESIDLRFRRAVLLVQMGRLTEAHEDLFKVLQRDPSHREALNEFGSVLVATGHRSAAQVAYREAVTRHPNDPTSRVNLGQFLLEESEPLAVCEQAEEALHLRCEALDHFEHALRVSPGLERAHEGLSYVLGHLGDDQGASIHRREAFKNRYIMPLPYWGRGKPLSVLKLVSTMGGNVKLQRFLDPRFFQTYVILPEFYDLKTPLPEHHLIVNAIGDAETSRIALEESRAVLALSSAPIVNPPAAVLATTRSNNALRLSAISGVITSRTEVLPRTSLTGTAAAVTLSSHGFEFPLLLRAPGFHTGLFFLRVDSFEALQEAVDKLPGQELIVMQYLDARGRDGKVRKYRVMFIDGQMYPLHVAISNHWKVHYFSAEMAESAENRAEDAAFLENMPDAIGPLAMQALREIQSTLVLDYGGIDFGLDQQGQVLLFEANATMVVNPPESDQRWKYRLAACQRIHLAVQKMFIDKAEAHNAISGRASTCGLSCY